MSTINLKKIASLKLPLSLSDFTAETHEKYGDSYTVMIGGKAGFAGKGNKVNVELADGTVGQLLISTVNTGEIMANGQAYWAPVIRFNPLQAKTSSAEAQLKALAEENAKLKAKMAALESDGRFHVAPKQK